MLEASCSGQRFSYPVTRRIEEQVVSLNVTSFPSCTDKLHTKTQDAGRKIAGAKLKRNFPLTLKMSILAKTFAFDETLQALDNATQAQLDHFIAQCPERTFCT
ncbi:hypothetical protein ACO0LF_30490 [Undibacterium sp. Di27W]|uniref:hypothetical protein n=1 Tax=Undibacterium sp. Di27W TaxID=3413036 RepID=UPI003BF0AA71